MPKERIAGISFSDDTLQAVVLEMRDGTVELRYIEEFVNKSRLDLWFLDAMFGIKKRIVRKISSVSIALDNASAFVHSFPLDSSLTQSEQKEHLEWELSSYIHDFKPKEYISDLHILQTREREQVSEILAVTAKRSFIYNIQQTLLEHKIALHVAEINHFAAQAALLLSNPEVKTRMIALASVTRARWDVGILNNGEITNYRYSLVSSIEDGARFLKELLRDSRVSELFIHGVAVTLELIEVLRSALDLKIIRLNPFRQLIIPSSFHEFDKFIGQEHRFAACVGCALMKL